MMRISMRTVPGRAPARSEVDRGPDPGSAELDPDLLAAPDLFEVVIAADRRLHHVHDDVAEVHQHPLAGLLALDGDHVAAGFLDLLAHMGGQRARLPVRGARHQHDTVEEIGQTRGVEHPDVLAFDVLERVDDETLQLAQIHRGEGPRSDEWSANSARACGPVEPVRVNIVQNRGRDQSVRLFAATELRAHRSG